MTPLASSASWQEAAACRARSPSTSWRTEMRVHIVALAGEADGDFVPFPIDGVGWARSAPCCGALQARRLQPSS